MDTAREISSATRPSRRNRWKATTMTLTNTQGNHMLLTTFRRSGAGVSTPVWSVPVDDGRVGMWTAAGTGKEKRLRRDPHVTIQACNARGKATHDARILDGTATIVQSGPLFDEVQRKIHRKYRRMIPLVRRISRWQGRFKPGQTFGDTVVLIDVSTHGAEAQARDQVDRTGTGG